MLYAVLRPIDYMPLKLTRFYALNRTFRQYVFQVSQCLKPSPDPRLDFDSIQHVPYASGKELYRPYA